MSINSVYLPSPNTIATSATAICVGEALFRKVVIRLFSDDSTVGRGILHGLDISQYLLGAAYFLSSPPVTSVGIIGAVVVLPLSLACKVICKWTHLNSKTYALADAFVQAMRLGSKMGCLFAAGRVFLRAEPGITKGISGCKVVILIGASFYEGATGHNYTSQSAIKDFYCYLRR